MKNKTYLKAVILSACISLFICPEVSGRINKAGGYGAFAACDTWQKWAEHITGGDFEFVDLVRYDNEEYEELAAYVYTRFMANAGDEEFATEVRNDEHVEYAHDDEYAFDTAGEYTVPGYDEWYDEEGRGDPGDEAGYEAEYNAEHYYSRACYDSDEYSADEYASFYDDEGSDMDGYYEAGADDDSEYNKAYKEDDEDECEDYDDEYEDCPSGYEEDACGD